MSSDAPETLDDLLDDLDSSDPRRRDTAVLVLDDFAEAVVEMLFLAIGRPENRDHRGTLVHALRAFRCPNHFSELFDLALHGDYEVQCHALSILQGQAFDVTADQLRAAKSALGALQPREHLPAADVELLRAELQAVLDRLNPSQSEHP